MFFVIFIAGFTVARGTAKRIFETRLRYIALLTLVYMYIATPTNTLQQQVLITGFGKSPMGGWVNLLKAFTTGSTL